MRRYGRAVNKSALDLTHRKHMHRWEGKLAEALMQLEHLWRHVEEPATQPAAAAAAAAAGGGRAARGMHAELAQVEGRVLEQIARGSQRRQLALDPGAMLAPMHAVLAHTRRTLRLFEDVCDAYLRWGAWVEAYLSRASTGCLHVPRSTCGSRQRLAVDSAAGTTLEEEHPLRSPTIHLCPPLRMLYLQSAVALGVRGCSGAAAAGRAGGGRAARRRCRKRCRRRCCCCGGGGDGGGGGRCLHLRGQQQRAGGRTS